MSALRRPEKVASKDVVHRQPGLWRRARSLSIVLLLTLVPSINAQVVAAQRAIEQLEGCSKQERQSGCIKLLKRRSIGDHKEAIKAQVRGGRIIWYEFNKKSGAVRRTN